MKGIHVGGAAAAMTRANGPRPEKNQAQPCASSHAKPANRRNRVDAK
jgi:hypothetical protein